VSDAARDAALRGELASLLGADAVLVDPQVTAPLLVDHHGRYHGSALGVTQPQSLEQVAALVRWCNERRIGLVPQGGNTGYCGAATPDASGRQVLLLLRRMNRIREIDAVNFSMIAEAGCVLERVQRAAAQAQRYFPLSLGAEGSCQLGGNLGTNAGGLNVVRYGMTRELVLGIEAVLGDGSVLHGLKSLRKDNTGYDLKSLLIGSEGTLGVITAASLKLWPHPRSSATAFIGIGAPADAIALLGHLRATGGERLSSFELLPRIAVELAARHIPGVIDPLPTPHPWYVLCELSSAADEPLSDLLQQVLSEAADRSLLADAVLATSERARAAFWRLRENVPEAQRLDGASIKHDISVPVASLAEFIAEAAGWVSANVPEAQLLCYGHAGDGNLHFNLHRPGNPAERIALLARGPQIRRALHDLVARYHGSISAEHGIGQLKREELSRYADPGALAAMRAIKRALDPNGIMNPGKLL
jgi:FAD/FMN-containing dehydrogenase